jgi:TRAP-type mannitol/chloroaromatic compound transport system permease large subunit
MNKGKDSYDYGSGLTQEPMDRVCELERELVAEKNRPMLAALLMTLLVFVLLVLGGIVYSIAGAGKSKAVGEVHFTHETARSEMLADAI